MIVTQMWVVINNLTTRRQTGASQIFTFTMLVLCLADRAEYQFGN